MQDRLVRGENITQTFQFVSSSNAKLGFVAYSQIKNPSFFLRGSFWEVPQSIYKPIQQQANPIEGKLYWERIFIICSK